MSIQTDVVPVATAFLHHSGTPPNAPIGSLAGPGDLISGAAGTFGTVGAVADHPQYLRVIVTAGHVFDGVAEGSAVYIRSGATSILGTLVVRRLTDQADYALVAVKPAALADNLYDDQLFGSADRVLDSYLPRYPDDIGRLLFVLTSDGQPKRVFCRGLKGYLQLPDGRTLRNVILTDAVTRGGDSGAALMDGNKFVWGLVRGAFVEGSGNAYSIFCPLVPILSSEGAAFTKA